MIAVHHGSISYADLNCAFPESVSEVCVLGPLFAAEQSQTRQGDVGEHWASLVYACFTPAITRPMSVNSIEPVRELRRPPGRSSSAGDRYEFTR